MRHWAVRLPGTPSCATFFTIAVSMPRRSLGITEGETIASKGLLKPTFSDNAPRCDAFRYTTTTLSACEANTVRSYFTPSQT